MPATLRQGMGQRLSQPKNNKNPFDDRNPVWLLKSFHMKLITAPIVCAFWVKAVGFGMGRGGLFAGGRS